MSQTQVSDILDSGDFGAERTGEKVFDSVLGEENIAFDETAACRNPDRWYPSTQTLSTDSREGTRVSFCALYPTTIWGENYQERFERLKQKWNEDTGHLASPVERAQHPAYQEIIGMGLPAVPLMLNDLMEGVEHWFWALQAITGADPVPSDHAGDLEKMADDWLEWGEENNLLQESSPAHYFSTDAALGEPVSEVKRYGLSGG